VFVAGAVPGAALGPFKKAGRDYDYDYDYDYDIVIP